MSLSTKHDVLKKFKKKAEQNRQMHFSISKQANLVNRTLHAFALIGSTITAILTFAEFNTFLPWIPSLTEGNYKLIIGLFASIIFIIIILEEYLGLGKKAATHETIGKQLTTFIRTASVQETNESLTQRDLDQLAEEYSRINENAPTIPDRVFLKEKQRLQIKIDISKKLEQTPHMSVQLYRIKMKIEQLLSFEERIKEIERKEEKHKLNSESSVLILLSGGIDSSALIHYHVSQGDTVEAVFFDYGQKSNEKEFLSATKVCDYYGIKLHTKQLGFKVNDFAGEYYCRNGLFIFAGCAFLEKPKTLISIGIHSGTPFYDSSPAFIKDTQTILDGYFGGSTRIIAPFIDYSKSQVYEYVIKNQVPVNLTYSCDLGQNEPCGNCLSCIDRRLLSDSTSI